MSTTHLFPPLEDFARKWANLYAPIAGDLAQAERIFEAELESRFPFVRRLVDQCSRFRGKRLRPALLLLAASACGEIRSDHHVLAAVVEMIHTATLVHDDILDDALIRRHAGTVNAEWGNEPAVLMGDYLFTHSFHLAASLESTLACRWIGRATNLVCEGELQQVHQRGNLDLDEGAYFDIIRGKTAELTAVCCRLGAHYAGADDSTVSALDRYGREIGVAFQIADDVLDLWGEERATGKTLGTDLEKQKLTLPLIRLLSIGSADVQEKVRSLLGEARSGIRRELQPYLKASGSLEYAWRRAKESVAQAVEALDVLPDSVGKTHLRILANAVVRRST